MIHHPDALVYCAGDKDEAQTLVGIALRRNADALAAAVTVATIAPTPVVPAV